MRAFTVERYGDKAGARAGKAADPTVGADDVLVRIQAAGINPLDRIIRDEMKTALPSDPPAKRTPRHLPTRKTWT